MDGNDNYGRNVILYSTDCFRCNLVKKMLDTHNVSYEEIKDKQIMIEKDFENAPVLEVDGKVIEEYNLILSWLKENGYYSLWGDNEDGNNEA